MPLDMLPFPPLSWTGFAWAAQVTLPGFTQEGPVELKVCVPLPQGGIDESDARRPSPEQAAAYQFLLDNGPGVWAALLTAVRDRVPEWSEWPLDRVSGEVLLDHLNVHHPTWDGAAYIGYWLSTAEATWMSEHGIGVTAHLYRVVSVGVGEEADYDTKAAADVRRLKRMYRGGPYRRG